MGSSFQDAFWGQNDQGLEVLLTRLREGRASLKFIQSIVSAKADLQEFYGKKLVKLCKDAPNELPGMSGTTETLLSELEREGHSYIYKATEIRSKVVAQFEILHKDLNELKHSHKKELKKMLKSKRQQLQAVERSQKNYFTSAESRQTAMKIKPRDLDEAEELKYEKKLQRLSRNELAADEKYMDAVKTFKSTFTAWRLQMSRTCQEFQLLEQKRLEMTKDLLLEAVDIEKGSIAELEKCLVEAEVALQHYEVQPDILHFINSKGTGNEIPPPPEYINFATETSMGNFNQFSDSGDEPDWVHHTIETTERAVTDDEIKAYDETDEDLGEILFSVKAVFSYSAQEDEELSFDPNDLIHVTGTEDDPWWFGFLDSTKEKGIFPSNFVERV